MNQMKLECGDVLLLKSDNVSTIYNYIYQDSKKIQEIFKNLIKSYQGLFAGKAQSNVIDTYIHPHKIQEKVQELSTETKLSKLIGKEYIFQFIYVGGGWCLVPERSGIHLYELPLNLILETDLFRYEPNNVEVRNKLKDIDEKVKLFWNKNFDYDNSVLNMFPSIVTEILNSDSPDRLTGQELICRIYKQSGIDLFEEKSCEHVQLNDVQKKFTKIH